MQYPSMMMELDYDPQFAIRGLHCDSKNGLLMKIDTYNHIQLSSVYRYGWQLYSSLAVSFPDQLVLMT